MLTWFRAHAPVATALVVFVVGSGGIASHTAHAAHGAPVVVEHDATAHRMSTAAADEGHRLDCLACSWTRSLRPRSAVAFTVAPAADGRVVHARVFTAHSPVRAAQPPLRSPPPSLVSA